MSTSQDIFRAVQKNDFVTASKHFGKIMEAKMKKYLTREYQNTAKTILHPEKEKKVDEVGLGF